jgi:hypothetical protein
MFAKLINMARSAAEVKKDLADMPCVVGESKYEGPKYPYGLCISLDEDALKKLGLEGDLPGVGDIIQFNAIAKVTNASQSESEGTDGGTRTHCRVELQITDMGIPGAHQADRDVDRSEQRRARFYGDPAKADVSADD